MQSCSIYHMVVFPNIMSWPFLASRGRSWPLLTEKKGVSHA